MPLRDQDGVERDRTIQRVVGDLRISRFEVSHDEVSLFDSDGFEVLLVQRPTHPGAGLSVDVSDRVQVAEDL